MTKYWNNQRYSECKLVSLYNAAIFHNLPTPIRYGEEYIQDCEKAYAITGPALTTGTERVIAKLNLKPIPIQCTLDEIRKNLPVEFSVFCHRGYHSILAVKVKGNRVLLTNYARGRTHWMPYNKLKRIHNKHVSIISWQPNSL